jgi:hypothetical protein
MRFCSTARSRDSRGILKVWARLGFSSRRGSELMMTAATHISTTSQRMDFVSPELVLVDPRLAERARALLHVALETHARKNGHIEGDAACGESAAVQARQRLLEAAVHSEVGDDVIASAMRRGAKLVATSSAAAAGAIVLLQAVLGQGVLG